MHKKVSVAISGTPKAIMTGLIDIYILIDNYCAQNEHPRSNNERGVRTRFETHYSFFDRY